MSLEGLRVGVVFGGANSEHDVSLGSARGVTEALSALGARVRLLGIDRDGVWHRSQSIDQLATSGQANGHGGSALRRGPGPDDLAGLDLVFPVIHGRGGEDGTVQGVLETARLPYVGCGVLASALAMDKRMTARLLETAGLPVVDTRTVGSVEELADVAADLPLPLFVKPNRAGSSVGASRVDRPEELVPAVALALSEDRTALLQPLVVADEVSIGILQTSEGDVHASGASLLRLGDGQRFFSYSGKYEGGSSIEIPALLARELLRTLQNMAITAFDQLDCTGLARVDFFVGRGGGEILLNEVNTLPGLGRHSHYPRLWAAAGIGYEQLVDHLVRGARGR